MLDGFKPISITSGIPTMTLTKNGIGFNKSAILKIDAPMYVRVLLNSEKNMVAICPCDEEDSYASPFAKECLKTVSVRWNSRDFTTTVSQMMNWNGKSRGKKVIGDYYSAENILVFDMNKAVELDSSDDK